MDDRIPPHSVPLEQEVLGTLLEQPRKAASEFLSMAPNVGAYFYDIRHQTIFRALVNMLDAGRKVTVDALHQFLADRKELEDAGDASYLAELLLHATSFDNLKDAADELRKFYVKRALVLASVTICNSGFDDDAETALAASESALLAIRADTVTQADLDMRELCRAALDRFEDALQNKGKLRGLATGFYDLDTRLRGLKPGQLIIIAARPSGGKTTLAMNIAERVGVDDRLPVGVFSMEMTAEELVTRLVCARARVPSDRLEMGEIEEGDQPKIASATSRISAAPIHIDETGGLTIAQLRARARRMAMRHGIQLLVVDYLQLMRGSGRRTANRNDEVSEISNGLKALAKELRVPVIALSQLNRDCERDGKREPRLSDLRDSGSVEQDADIVMFLHPHEADADPRPVDLIIRKHRNGAVGKVPLMFLKSMTRFESRSPIDE